MALIYHYFVVSLPTLRLGEPAPLRPEQLKEACEEWLPRREAREIGLILAGRVEEEFAQPAIVAWLDLETGIRNAVARARGARLRTDPTPSLRPAQTIRAQTEQAVAEAFTRANPLERELALDRYRWALLEEICLFEPYGVPAIVVYSFRLNLVLRWERLPGDGGSKQAEQWVETTMAKEKL